jgi:hypothetical protein
METRTEISSPKLYLLLNREFARRRSRPCPMCVVPFPFRVDRLEPEAPNWEISFPRDCGGECQSLLQELVAEHQALYELVPSTEEDERA